MVMWLLHPDHELKLKPEHVKMFNEGEKKTTIRYRPDCVRYPAKNLIPLTEPETNTLYQLVVIEYSRVVLFKALTGQDALNDGFNTLEELKEALTEIYGEIQPNEPVTIYYMVKWPG